MEGVGLVERTLCEIVELEESVRTLPSLHSDLGWRAKGLVARFPSDPSLLQQVAFLCFALALRVEMGKDGKQQQQAHPLHGTSWQPTKSGLERIRESAHWDGKALKGSPEFSPGWSGATAMASSGGSVIGEKKRCSHGLPLDQAAGRYEQLERLAKDCNYTTAGEQAGEEATEEDVVDAYMELHRSLFQRRPDIVDPQVADACFAMAAGGKARFEGDNQGCS